LPPRFGAQANREVRTTYEHLSGSLIDRDGDLPAAHVDSHVAYASLEADG
jgi:hypothetical protein